jgi:starvation-inducible DNA-binding protein
MINIGLDTAQRTAVAELLNKILANEMTLYIKTLKCHWNVEGKHFGALHLFFKEQYEAMLDIADDVAERARSLDVMAFGTMTEYMKHASLKEQPGENPDDLAMIAWLQHDHEEIIRQLRKAIVTTAELGDEGTSNFLTDLMEKHEKMCWMLRAHLNK